MDADGLRLRFQVLLCFVATVLVVMAIVHDARRATVKLFSLTKAFFFCFCFCFFFTESS